MGIENLRTMPEKRGEINTENWIEVKKGMVFETQDEKPEWQRTVDQTPASETDRWGNHYEQKGMFNSNNGILTFVDIEARQFVAPSTPERMQELEDAGYKEGSMYVPFSNGQIPAEPELKAKWEKMLSERQEN